MYCGFRSVYAFNLSPNSHSVYLWIVRRCIAGIPGKVRSQPLAVWRVGQVLTSCFQHTANKKWEFKSQFPFNRCINISPFRHTHMDGSAVVMCVATWTQLRVLGLKSRTLSTKNKIRITPSLRNKLLTCHSKYEKHCHGWCPYIEWQFMQNLPLLMAKMR